MELINNKAKMVVPDDVGSITISGVPLDVEDGITWVPHDMVADALSHGLTVYTGKAAEGEVNEERVPAATAKAAKGKGK